MNQTVIFEHQNLISTQSQTKTTEEFNALLKQICTNNEMNSQFRLSNMMNNELNDEDLNKILFQNINQYSHCERLKQPVSFLF